MAGDPLTQKEIARKYGGNLGYFRKTHSLRRIRRVVFAVTALCSLVAALTFRFWGRQEFVSKGPISQNHARFASDCRVCHIDANSPLKALSPKKSGNRSPGASVAMQPDARSLMDQACLNCHPATGLHVPQAASFALRAVSNELAVVHATNCFVCHREHVGRERMSLPNGLTCASCHNNADELKRASVSIRLKNPAGASTHPSTGENRDLGDGLVRFVAPARSPGSLKPFPDFAHGHPPFGYEDANLRDPADLKFNHERHRRAEIVAMSKDQKLDCTDCHKLGPEGAHHQPVSYARHCQQCHTLQLLQSLPKLLIPHGDAEKVRYFLASLDTSITNAIRADGVSDPAELSKRLDLERKSLRERGRDTLADLEQMVFFEGDPKDIGSARRTHVNDRKFVTECAKCHTVSSGDAISAPKVNPPNIAQRWLERGSFTHLPHQHMACVDCHKAAETSQKTSDILLPSQKLCADCHRPPGDLKLTQLNNSTNQLVSFKPDGTGSAKTQREMGGIKWDCQSCHVFHAPPEAVNLIKSGASPSAQPAAVSPSFWAR
jgi:hypothetical protein